MISSGVGQWAAVAGGRMYWTDLGIGKIQRVNLDGTGLQDLVTTGLRFPRGMAVDDSGGKMYWMDGGTLKVHRANLDGS
jgi:low density lipoprotein receptor-related protein 5/6